MISPTSSRAKRFGPDTLAPWLIDWGLDNRSAVVRVPPDRGSGARMEVRLGDATANPYLAMAAVGAAAYLGIADKIEPGDKLEGYGYDPDRAQILPMRLGDALDSLEADSELARRPRRLLRLLVPGLQAQRDRAVRALRHRLGIPRVRLPPMRPRRGGPPRRAAARRACRCAGRRGAPRRRRSRSARPGWSRSCRPLRCPWRRAGCRWSASGYRPARTSAPRSRSRWRSRRSSRSAGCRRRRRRPPRAAPGPRPGRSRRAAGPRPAAGSSRFPRRRR